MNYLRELDIKEIIAHALKEDRGSKDITSETFVASNKQAQAVLIAKEPAVICGLSVAASVFKLQDKRVHFRQRVSEGTFAKKNTVIAEIRGNARSIITAERVALNFISLLSGVATKTRRYVEAVKPYKAKVLDTRKTIPGLRLFEKYAVRIGGGFNHRMDLEEMILVKDNHIRIAGLGTVLKKIKQKRLQAKRIEVEVTNLNEFRAVLEAHPDIIMLDNMPVNEMKKAVALRNIFAQQTSCRPRPLLEASGGITLSNIQDIAATGVDFISVGHLTHSLSSADISLEIL